MKTTTWMKLRFAVGAGAALLLADGAATAAISPASGDDTLTPQQIAKQAQDAYAALSSYSDTGTVVAELAGQTVTTTFSIRLQRTNLYRIDWSQSAESRTFKGVVWSDGSGDFFVMEPAEQEKIAQPQKMQNMAMAMASATGVSGSAAATIPGTFFKQNWGDVLGVPASGRSQLKKERDEKAGGVDCFVVSSHVGSTKLPADRGDIGPMTTTLWIGKRDHLIHQTRTTMEGGYGTPPELSDSDIKKILERQNKPATPEAMAALRTEMKKSTESLRGEKTVFTQTHENISVNKKFSPADFAR